MIVHPEEWFQTDAAHEAALRWRAHLDAGRLGHPPPPDPAIAAQREANDALFRRIAHARTRRAP
jgi:hypothetical protein